MSGDTKDASDNLPPGHVRLLMAVGLFCPSCGAIMQHDRGDGLRPEEQLWKCVKCAAAYRLVAPTVVAVPVKFVGPAQSTH